MICDMRYLSAQSKRLMSHDITPRHEKGGKVRQSTYGVTCRASATSRNTQKMCRNKLFFIIDLLHDKVCKISLTPFFRCRLSSVRNTMFDSPFNYLTSDLVLCVYLLPGEKTHIAIYYANLCRKWFEKCFDYRWEQHSTSCMLNCYIEMFLQDGNKTEYTAYFNNNEFMAEDIQLPLDSGNMKINMHLEIVKFLKIL